MARRTPSPFSIGLDEVPGVGRRAVADDLGSRCVAPRALASSRSSSISAAGALAEDEPVARRVERPGDGLDALALARQAHAAHVA